MPRIFNRKENKEIRKYLRSDMPEAEKLLWSKLKGKQLAGYKFRRQHGLEDFILDFYCPKALLAIEVDGDSHCEDKNKDDDQEKQSCIESHGIRVLRFTNDEIYDNLEMVLEKILAHLS